MRSLAFSLLLLFFTAVAAHAAERPNVLLITVDDMNCDSMGAFGCELKGTTPRMDALAESGLRFAMAHVQVGNCFPSRNVMWSGRFPHQTGVEGFYQVKDADYPHLADVMKRAGYHTSIRGKVSHSTPYQPYAWDLVLDPEANIKDVESYGRSAAAGIAAAKEAGKPFCVMVNVSDPHKPFYSGEKDKHQPTHVFTADEVPIPGFLFDDPVVRKELALYYSSVRRADDCVGKVLDALEASGESDNTFVLFLSDHGMPLPFAKTQLYHHSTRTPLVVRWPGVTKANTVDESHMVSAVDFLPTLCDVIGVKTPEGVTGRSFAPLLKGETQEGRDFVVKEYNENAGASRDPMRAVQTKRYLYLFNPWSNGERVFATATTGTQTYRRMAQLAKTDETMAARHDLYQHRVPEELYDVVSDPDCLVNLVDDPVHAGKLAELRSRLETWMEETDDHALVAFRKRDDAEAREAYVQAKEQEAAERRSRGRKKPGTGKKNRNLIRLDVPKSVTPGKAVTVAVDHRLTAKLGEQQLHVTLKGPDGKRVERKVVSAKGTGTTTVAFDVPASLAGKSVFVAAFVGEEYAKNLQHVQTEAIPVATPE